MSLILNTFRDEALLVVSLGKLLIQTEPRSMEQKNVRAMHGAGANADEILAEIISQSYDKFLFEIQDIQVLVASASEDWETAINRGRGSEMHILEPTFLRLSTHLSVISDDPRLPKVKIACELPSIQISVTEDRILSILSILTTLPLPENEEPIAAKPISKDSNILGSSLSLLKFLDEKQQLLQKKPSVGDNIDVTDDVVQFIDLEANFVLNEISITILKSASTGSSSTEEYATPTEDFSNTNLPTPSFKSVAFDVPSTYNRKKMLTIKAKQLEMNMTQRTYDLKVDLKLGAVSFDHYRWRNEKEKIFNVINTPTYDNNFDYLFTLNYTNCKKISPEFVSKHMSVEQLVEIKLSSLVLLLNQDGITELIQIANDIQTKMDMVLSSSKKEPLPGADRFVNANDQTTTQALLSVAKERLPIIMEDETVALNTPSKFLLLRYK